MLTGDPRSEHAYQKTSSTLTPHDHHKKGEKEGKAEKLHAFTRNRLGRDRESPTDLPSPRHTLPIQKGAHPVHFRPTLKGATISVVAALLFLTPATAQASLSQVSPARFNSPNDVLGKHLLKLAQQYLQDRANRLNIEQPTRGNATKLTDIPVTAEFNLQLNADRDALDARRELLERVDGGNSHAEARILDPRFHFQGSTTIVQLTEKTKLYYARTGPNSPDFEEYSIPHRMVFVQFDSTWKLSSATAELNNHALPPDTQPAPINESITPPSPPSFKKGASTNHPTSSGPALPNDEKKSKKSSAAFYDYGAMLSYAKRYAMSRNHNYRSYSNDCTNFLSQIMKAGGWLEIGAWPGDSRADGSKWFYGPDGVFATSYSWAAAENWFHFARTHSHRVFLLDNVWKMRVTDVLQADWDGPNGSTSPDGTIDHSMFVTARDGSGEYASELYLSYHTNDTLDKRLSRIIAENPQVWWYAHRT